MQVVNLKDKFNLFNDHWNPKIIGELNGQAVKIVKVKGEFIWHDHKDEDELFYIIKGSLVIELKDKTITLNEGEMLTIPKGVDHRPIAEEEVWVLLFEPAIINHTGNVRTEITVDEFEKI